MQSEDASIVFMPSRRLVLQVNTGEVRVNESERQAMSD